MALLLRGGIFSVQSSEKEREREREREKESLFEAVTLQFMSPRADMPIQFSVSTVSLSKTVPFQTTQFSMSTQFKCKYSLIVKKISISKYLV